MWCVYMLKSSKKRWYYIGSTNNIEKRLAEHNNSKVQSTKSHCPLKVIFIKNFSDEQGARNYEQRLKDKRIEKEQLIKQYESS